VRARESVCERRNMCEREGMCVRERRTRSRTRVLVVASDTAAHIPCVWECVYWNMCMGICVREKECV